MGALAGSASLACGAVGALPSTASTSFPLSKASADRLAPRVAHRTAMASPTEPPASFHDASGTCGSCHTWTMLPARAGCREGTATSRTLICCCAMASRRAYDSARSRSQRLSMSPWKPTSRAAEVTTVRTLMLTPLFFTSSRSSSAASMARGERGEADARRRGGSTRVRTQVMALYLEGVSSAI